MRLRWNLDTGEQMLLLDPGDVRMVYEAPNDPVYNRAVELLNRGRRREARRLGYKIMVRCLANRWYRMMDYCGSCLVRSICPVTRPHAVKWLLEKAYVDRRSGRRSILTSAAEGLGELARHNLDVATAVERAATLEAEEEPQQNK